MCVFVHAFYWLSSHVIQYNAWKGVCFFIKGAVIVSHSNCSFSTIVKDFVGRPGLEFPVV